MMNKALPGGGWLDVREQRNAHLGLPPFPLELGGASPLALYMWARTATPISLTSLTLPLVHHRLEIKMDVLSVILI